MPRRAGPFAAALCAAVFFCACAGAQPLADALNLFLVVERGDGDRVTLLDGDRLEPVHRFALRGAIADEPQFTPDGRHAFFATRDGWVIKFDLRSLNTVAEVRAGTRTQGLALSSDGGWLAVGNAEPATLVLLDAELRIQKTLPAADAAQRLRSPVSMVRNSAARRAFVAALPALKEIWEVSYDPKAPEIAAGLVHDYKLREGAFVPGFLNPRRTPLEEAIAEFCLVPDGRQLVGAAPGGGALHVVHLDVRRRIVRLEMSGEPRPGAGIFWRQDGQLRLAVPTGRRGGLAVLEASNWKAIDLDRDQVSAQLPRGVGLSAAGAEFDRHGRIALAGSGSPDGAVAVYDASTARELKRLDLQGVVGKYNVFNQITRHLN